ncbi:polysaccharide pyruvyl transferase family protein [Glutamicibacter mishrai]|uniref:polysaccharide pyruvyl transferase family protein n=1 Tax=Glutamicibacter mishrai TaxID=1775880 RepID=UPI001558AF11|nr:polysaccharide pyruvyl transferase family protein [Glutamicibacter mishrai]
MAKEFAKNVVRRIWRSGLYAEVLHLTDLVGATIAKPKASEDGFTVVMSPAGDGNIGDSAMLLSFLDRSSGPVKVMMKVPKDGFESSLMSEIRETYGPRVTFVSGRAFYRSLPPMRLSSSIRFAREINGAKSFFVHGADTIDGGNVSASLAAWSLCRVASRVGLRCGVLGFSWREQVPEVVAKSMSKANKTVPAYLRDEISWQRIRKSGAVKAIPVADMAFSLERETIAPTTVKNWIEDQALSDKPIVALNVSGLISNYMDQTPEIKAIVEQIHTLGARVLFVPHVIRETDDDLAVCRTMYGKFANEDDLLVDELLSPLQVRWIASKAAAVVTGRMHFSILSLSTATPVIALATAGKVEGLFKLFELERLVVPVSEGFGSNVARVLSGLWQERVETSELIKLRLPAIRERSMKNFELL